jgi:UDP-GlcNAc:undecaprenyl-phosphate GlcNAc-1-phosphate transferase
MNLIFLLLCLLLNLIFFIYFNKIVKIYNLYDYPDNYRKFQKIKIPLMGGLIVFFNLLLFYINFLIININDDIFYDINNFTLIIGAFFFYILGFLDDKIDLKANLKLIIQIAILTLTIFFNKNILINEINLAFLNKIFNIQNFSLPFTILCFLLFINALNMFDGVNLQCGFYSLFVIFFLLLKFFNLIYIYILISLLFFLFKNFQNKAYLGNNGSYLLGFVIAYLFIIQSKNKTLYAEEIFLVMLIPGLDMLRLFISRLLKKRHPFSPDLNHIHHILLRNFGKFYSFSLVQLMIVIPIFFIFFIDVKNYLYLIILSLVFYFLIINFNLNKVKKYFNI